MGSTTLTIVYISISIIVIIADLLTACHCYNERKNYSQVLTVTCVASAAVQLTYLLSVLATGYFAVSFLSSLYFISVDFAILTLLTFIRAYTIKIKKKFNNIMKYVLAVIFVIDTALFLLNPFKEVMVHYAYVGGFIARYAFALRPLYWLHLIFDYAMVVIILYHLIRRAASVPSEYKKQYLSSVYSILAVVALNAVFLFYPRLFGHDALDYSIWGYSIATFSLYVNFFRYPINGMKSYYNSWVVENVNQGVVLFNYEGNLIIHNEKVHTIFENKNINQGMSIEEFSDMLGLGIKADRAVENYSFQHYFNDDSKNTPIRIDHRCLFNKKNQVLGQLFVFTSDAGDMDLLTSFYSWENFKQILVDVPDNFNPPITIAVCDINGLGDINTKFGRNVGDKAIELLANLIRKHFSGESYYVRGQEATLIILSFDLDEEEVRKNLKNIHDEIIKNNDLDCFLNIQSAVSVVDNNNRDVLSAIKQAFKGMKNKKLLDVKSHHSELVTSLIRTLEECDNDTEAHVKRTQILGAELGKRLGLSDVQLSDLALLCILHDIGKIGIPLEILNKPGKLNDSEWRMMKTHTEKGYQIATSSQELSDIAEMILHHHETWDGRGYPDGLSKESIPLLSRIIAVVDSYDAMVNDRAYRPAMPIEDAIKELRRCAGTQFDPSIVNEFIRMLPEVEHIATHETFELLESVQQNKADQTPRSVEESTENANVHKVKYSRYVLNSKMRIVIIDKNFEEITGYSQDDVESMEISQTDLLPEADRTEYMKMVNEQLAQNSLAYFEHRLKCKDGSIKFVFCYGKVYYDSAEREERSEVIVFDSTDTYAMKVMINEEQNKAELRLAKWEDKYRCDSLTGLLNHEAFKNDIEMKLTENNKVMLLMMDVDKFKQYNDSFGHRAGDEFLIMISQALTSTLRKDDLACRMGGDEFAAALFYNENASRQIMLERAQQICDKLNMVLTSQKGGTSLSMGVTFSGDIPEEAVSFNKMYENADTALYEAKESGRARMVVFKQ